MNGPILVRIIGLTTAIFVFATGILIVVGTLVPDFVPEKYQVFLGATLCVYGIYRTIMILIDVRKSRKVDGEA